MRVWHSENTKHFFAVTIIHQANSSPNTNSTALWLSDGSCIYFLFKLKWMIQTIVQTSCVSSPQRQFCFEYKVVFLCCISLKWHTTNSQQKLWCEGDKDIVLLAHVSVRPQMCAQNGWKNTLLSTNTELFSLFMLLISLEFTWHQNTALQCIWPVCASYIC